MEAIRNGLNFLGTGVSDLLGCLTVHSVVVLLIVLGCVYLYAQWGRGGATVVSNSQGAFPSQVAGDQTDLGDGEVPMRPGWDPKHTQNSLQSGLYDHDNKQVLTVI